MSWLRREDLEERELRILSPWACPARDSGGRRHAEPVDPMRTDFQRDRDRIIHCAAFRRLQHKTQVLAAYEGDHYRSRMTHSLEVAQLARSAALALRLNPDLTEAIALAHDLGHPPFGHAGEEALDQRMAGHGGFRHNAQGLRVVDVLEGRRGAPAGLNLTRAVRRSLLKGPIPDGFPISADLDLDEGPPLEADVVDLCDRIAYLCHDLDDALRAGLVDVDTASGSLELWQRAADVAGSQRIGRVISEMVSLLIHDLVASCAATLAAQRPPELRRGVRPRLPVGQRPRLRHSGDMAVLVQEQLEFLRGRFYRSGRVLETMHAGSARIHELFDRLLAHPDRLPADARERLAHDPLERCVCDHVAGMTDRYLYRSSGAGDDRGPVSPDA